MSGTIVVGYDASPGSRAALDRALEIAAAFGDRLMIGFGVTPPGSLGEESARTARRCASRPRR